MTSEVGEVINYIIDGFLRAPIVNSIARNPIYTALVVTAIIMIIILIVFRDIDADETLFTMTLRSGFWVFVMMLGILMIHNRVLGAEVQTQSKEGQYEQVFTPSAVGKFESDFVPVSVGRAKNPTEFSGGSNYRPQVVYVPTSGSFANVNVL